MPNDNYAGGKKQLSHRERLGALGALAAQPKIRAAYMNNVPSRAHAVEPSRIHYPTCYDGTCCALTVDLNVSDVPAVIGFPRPSERRRGSQQRGNENQLSHGILPFRLRMCAY
jgi:hypothetical protein